MATKTVNTYCRICVAACGLDVEVDTDANAVRSIRPDRENPYTWRDFCKKGKTANELVTHPRRLRRPMKRVGDRYVEATYEEATADIAQRLNAIIDRHGPDAIGSYHGNPMGFSFATTTFWTGLLDAIGTGNRFWVGSLDQNNSHVVAEAMYGNELTSLVSDIDRCDCFLLIGMDPAVSRFNWMDNAPNGWSRVRERVRDGADLIVVDPRRSATAAAARTHVALRPGEDWAFLLALVKVILDERLEHLSEAVPLAEIARLRAAVAAADLDGLAGRCEVPADVIRDVARRFAAAPTAMCLTHTGVSHNAHGTIGEWLGHVLNLITNRIDTPGGRRFESGYVDIGKVMQIFAPGAKHESRLRGLPTIAGFHSVAELPAEITTPGRGQIRGMLMAFGNPVTSGPNGDRLDAALGELELLVSVDLVQRESHRHADWLIPGTHWLEREELHPLFANLQERPYVQYAHRAVDKPAGVKEEWEFFTDLALAMDRNLFGKPGVNALVRASRAAARVTGRPKLQLHPEWVQRGLVMMGRRLRWKTILAHPHGLVWDEPKYGELAGALLTDDKRVHLAPALLIDELQRVLGTPPSVDDAFPLLMINRRGREAMNSWLNESPGLFRAKDRTNLAEIHHEDAAAAGVVTGDTVRLSSRVGSIEVVCDVTDTMRPGVVCVPHGWGTRVFDPVGGAAPQSYGVNRNLLVDEVDIDPLSQTPGLNSTAVRLETVTAGPADADRR
jgi:formate dehydrogenase